MRRFQVVSSSEPTLFIAHPSTNHSRATAVLHVLIGSWINHSPIALLLSTKCVIHSELFSLSCLVRPASHPHEEVHSRTSSIVTNGQSYGQLGSHPSLSSSPAIHHFSPPPSSVPDPPLRPVPSLTTTIPSSQQASSSTPSASSPTSAAQT